ncbi:NERD domain-containing protein [Sulfurimonas sp.]
MILKEIDDKTDTIKTLTRLYNSSNSIKQKQLIYAELHKIKAGYEAEKENSFYLNVRLADNKNVLIINDIRLEHNGKIAQFDHLLITRFGIEILESKSATGVMCINNDGSISITYKNKTNTYPNPIEQAKRQALVLKDFLKGTNLIPKRVEILGGVPISISVLIHPQTTLSNTDLQEGFERADSFLSKRSEAIDKISYIEAYKSLAKAFSITIAKEIGQKIIEAHKPLTFDYEKKFKVAQQPNTLTKKKEEIKICPRCKEGTLVLRKPKSKQAREKYGNKEFYGCSRYPKCRYTES